MVCVVNLRVPFTSMNEEIGLVDECVARVVSSRGSWGRVVDSEQSNPRD